MNFRLFVLIALAVAVPASTFAADARFQASLRRLDPATRLEQICDVEAMDRLSKDGSGFRADRAKSDVTIHPQHKGSTLIAPGAAFRSKGRWYQLSFKCSGTPDHMSVTAFEYRAGAVIPEERWDELGLTR